MSLKEVSKADNGVEITDEHVQEMTLEEMKLAATKLSVSLKDKQLKFCKGFVRGDLSGTQTAIKAGYSPKSAHVQASRLLKNAKASQLILVLRQIDYLENGWPVSKKRAYLGETVNDLKATRTERTKALEVMCRLDKDFSDESGTGNVNFVIRPPFSTGTHESGTAVERVDRNTYTIRQEDSDND